MRVRALRYDNAGLLDLHKPSLHEVVSFTLTVNPTRRYPPIRTMTQLGAKTAGAKEGRWVEVIRACGTRRAPYK